jgi:hypothetical protein
VQLEVDDISGYVALANRPFSALGEWRENLCGRSHDRIRLGWSLDINVDPTGQTDVPGVWAAGNVTDPAAQVGGSAAAGALAAIRINADLVAEETTRPSRATKRPGGLEERDQAP